MNILGRGGIFIGPHCSNRCAFCISGVGGVQKKSELKKQERTIWKDLISYKKKGYTDIEISGSDPLEYDKIIPLLRYIKKLGFNNILLNTHGKNLCDKNFANDVINAGVNVFRIPLYGSNAAIHDSVTRVKGSFKKTVKGIRNIKKINPKVELILHTLVLQENKENIFNIFQLAEKLQRLSFNIGVLYIAKGNYFSYVPYKELAPYLEKITKYVFKYNDYNIEFYDIPHCVFGFYNRFVIRSKTIDTGKSNQAPKIVRSQIENLPKYRLKTKLDICQCCKVRDKCDGFLINDIKKYGTGNLKPIT